MVVKARQPEDGFTPERTHYRLVFADPAFDGLKVTVRSMSIRRRLEFDTRRYEPVETFKEVIAKQDYILETLASVLVDWNLRDPDTGKPVPMTAAAMLEQEREHIQPIVDAWINAITAAPRPLDRPAPADPLADIPMSPIQDSTTLS